MDRRLAGLACALCAVTAQLPQAFAQVITTPPPQPRQQLVCMGRLTLANNMTWESQRVELSLDYARNLQASSLKSDIGALNASLSLEADDAFLRGRESKPRILTATDRGIAISELKISRSTGAFTLVVLSFRELDVLDGRSQFEGDCSLQGSSEKKF
jgi:hypothetical protein